MARILRGVGADSRRSQPLVGVAFARFSKKRQSSVQDQHRTNEIIASERGVLLVEEFQTAVSRTLAERRGLA